MAVVEPKVIALREAPAEADSTPARLRRDTGALTLATVVVGAGNFAYSLVLTWLLPIHAYAVFAAAQSLLLAAISIANASLPWVLTHRLSHNPDEVEGHRDALAFVVLASALEGVLLAGVIVAVLRSLASLPVLGVVALDTVVIFLACPASGYLQGAGRFTRLARLRVANLAAKLAAGAGLVMGGAGAAGALLSIALGDLPLLGAGSLAFRRQLTFRWRTLLDTSLWRQTVSLGAVQGLVAALASLDLVAATLLWKGRPSDLASYQVAILCSRVPFFLSASISQATFQRLSSKQAPTAEVIGLALRMMVVLYVPVAMLIATAPSGLVHLLFPHSYANVTSLLPYTAVTGLLLAGVNVFSTFFQAQQRYRRCLLALSFACCDAAAVLIGFHEAGIVGMAIGSVVGMGIVLAALVVATLLTWRVSFRPDARMWAAIALCAPLGLLRRADLVWLAYGAGLGLWSADLAFGIRRETPLGRLPGLRGRS